MSKPPDQSNFDYYTEDARKLTRGARELREKLAWYFAKGVFGVAIIYGAVTLSPFYFGLGLAGMILFWWLERRLRIAPVATDEPETRS